ncbi:MAG: 6-hydroxymethylpterin diphosphokinase MptE-like protein [Treponema sp.]|uniref:6-hydroxymethylpterin diphosphokinase MptE-like protein n=1 Tax=Treponema sp. TaxID=166 RepID=UPI002A9116A4|nr:6-hydroxymethylpterin diphosphokinase MptE-like protein [Treponema sp.]MDY6399045.1 6-hydroxymethylpterin diphosphokinase MptE-like protein [Treponema sp.]
MADTINQKPCVVQKIETPQGFSVSYKDHLLYSKYNPAKNICSTIEKLQLLPGTIFLCCSPVLNYGLTELLNKLSENCLVILCEAEKELYDFSLNEGLFNISDKRLISCSPDKLNDLPLLIYNFASSGLYKRVIRIDMSAGTQFNKEFYEKLFAACSNSVMTFWKNRITLTRFGRRYSKNLFTNLHYLADSKPISDFFATVEKPLIVFGAGESTQTLLPSLRAQSAKQSILSDYYVICADTALQPLLKNGIKPDGVFVEEAQSVIVKAFTGTPKDIHIFAGLSSIPNLVHRAGAENISYFFTEYAEGRFFDSLKSQSFMPAANKPFGSVGLTAVYYALKFRKNENIPVYVTGLDFSYSIGITHTKGALAHILRLIQTNRLTSPQNYAAAYGLGTEKVTGKNGQTVITTPTLKSYAAMFKNFFASEKNLFDAGESGIDLGLPHAEIDCKIAATPRNDRETSETEATRHCEAEGRGNPYAKEIETFLQNERKALENLRDLLTGKTELKDDKLLEEIRKIAEPREYLYLHFPDGFKFSLEQSFLNRIRIELDYFLKLI